MLPLKLIILFLIIYSACGTSKVFGKVTSLEDFPIKNDREFSPVKVDSKTDFNGRRNSRHIGGGGLFGGVGVIGGTVGGFSAPAYASPPLAVVSSVPVITSVPVVTAIPSYPVYDGYGGYGDGYGGGFGGFGGGFGVAKFKVKSFGFGGGLFG